MPVIVDQAQVLQRYAVRFSDATGRLQQMAVVDTRPFVPKRTGNLEMQVSFDETGFSYNAPYAGVLYYSPDFQFSRARNPMAGALWFERSKAANLAKWCEEVCRWVQD